MLKKSGKPCRRANSWTESRWLEYFILSESGWHVYYCWLFYTSSLRVPCIVLVRKRLDRMKRCTPKSPNRNNSKLRANHWLSPTYRSMTTARYQYPQSAQDLSGLPNLFGFLLIRTPWMTIFWNQRFPPSRAWVPAQNHSTPQAVQWDSVNALEGPKPPLASISTPWFSWSPIPPQKRISSRHPSFTFSEIQPPPCQPLWIKRESSTQN